MLTTMVIDAMMTAFISMFCVFVTAPHFCGAYFLCQGRCPLSPAGGDSTRTVVFVDKSLPTKGLILTYIELKEKFEEYELLIYI